MVVPGLVAIRVMLPRNADIAKGRAPLWRIVSAMSPISRRQGSTLC